MSFPLIPLLLLAVALPGPANAVEFDDYFLDKALRVDLHHFGTDGQESICIDEVKQEPFYAGPKKHLIDPREYGSHWFEVYDSESGNLIFSRGFCTLFGEWKTTKEARDGLFRVFEHTLIMPFPKKPIRLKVSGRKRDNSFEQLLDQTLVLEQMNVRTDNPHKGVETIQLQNIGPSEKKVDIVILGDGYTASETDDYVDDARDAMEALFSRDPFKAQRKQFNIWGVKTPSPESGIDEPRKGLFKATAFDTSFNTFNLDRYAMTTSVKALRDAAACVPYDFIIIIFNSSRYGGGGVYNHFAMVTGNEARPGVLLHEMGHCIAALGDEYVDSTVAYLDMYPEGVEPWEPNLTALLDGKTPKWAEMVAEGTPIPTPANRGYYKTTGCFEGAGYKPEGLYRPGLQCTMRSLSHEFCPVCQKAIMESIRFYTE